MNLRAKPWSQQGVQVLGLKIGVFQLFDKILPGSSGLTFKSEADKPQTTHVRTLTSDLAELETLVAEPPPQPQPKRPSSSISTSKTSDKRKQPRLLTHQVQEEVDKEQQRLQYEKYLHEKHEQVKKSGVQP